MYPMELPGRSNMQSQPQESIDTTDVPIRTLYIVPQVPNMHNQVQEYFGQFGEVESVKVFHYGYVQFKSAESTQAAFAMGSHRIGEYEVMIRPADERHQPAYEPFNPSLELERSGPSEVTSSNVNQAVAAVAAQITTQKPIQTGHMFKMGIEYFGINSLHPSVNNSTEYDLAGTAVNDAAQKVRREIAAYRRVQTGDMFKMDIDCFEEAFDYLPLNDLIAVGQTCKYLSHMAGYIYRQKYQLAKVECSSEQVKAFPEYIDNIYIWSEDDFDYFVSNQSKFHSLKRIKIEEHLDESQIRSIQGILSRIEELIIDSFERRTLEMLIFSCPNIKRLDIWLTDEKINEIQVKCPVLEHITTDPDFPGMMKFIELNPSIRRLDIYPCSGEKMEKTLKSMRNAEITLDDLSICYDEEQEEISIILLELHKRGKFKRLHLFGFLNIIILNQELIKMLTPLNEFLISVSIGGIESDTKLSAFKNLENIEFTKNRLEDDYKIDFVNADINLSNLKRVTFGKVTFDQILYLIDRGKKLKSIRIIDHLRDMDIIDLRALAKEREKLPTERGEDLNVTIFVKEEMYLATKKAMTGNQFGLVHMKRMNGTVSGGTMHLD